MKYLQLMSGDSGRDFSKIMFNFGVAMVGPGDYGNLKDNWDKYPSKELKKVKWLTKMEEGDRIVLHNSRSATQAVGEVLKKDNYIYHYSNVFGDIDNWGLQHYCHVKWKDIIIKFKGMPLTRSTASYLRHEKVIEEIEKRWSNAEEITPNKNATFELPNEISSDKLEELLIDQGLRIKDAHESVKTFSHVRKLANWYLMKGDGFPSSEHEIRAFLVIPMLNALGWSYQKMAVEYDRMDLILFSDNERKIPKILIETKSMWTGSESGRNQLQRYILDRKKTKILQGLQFAMVTDGLIYWIYKLPNLEQPFAYLNLKKMWEKNPAYPDCGGILDLIKCLVP